MCVCARECVCFSFRLCFDLDWHCRLLELSNEMRALLVSDPEIHEEPAAGERAAGRAFYLPTKYTSYTCGSRCPDPELPDARLALPRSRPALRAATCCPPPPPLCMNRTISPAPRPAARRLEALPPPPPLLLPCTFADFVACVVT